MDLKWPILINFDPKSAPKGAKFGENQKCEMCDFFGLFLSKIDKKTDFCDLNRQKYHKFITSFA